MIVVQRALREALQEGVQRTLPHKLQVREHLLLVEPLRQRIDSRIPNSLELQLSLLLPHTPGPISRIGVDVRLDPSMQRQGRALLLLQEILDPPVPIGLEAMQGGGPGELVADGVVDGVVGDQLEVPQGPVVGNRREEVVHRGVLYAELARIVRVDRHCVAQA